jgi:adenosine deaminase
MNFKKLPKIELHLHLDCSLSYGVVSKIDPGISRIEFETEFIAPDKCLNLADYLTRPLRSIELMQTKEELRMVTHDLFEQLKSDNVIYAEIRFAPLQHLNKGLASGEVVQIVNDAADEAMKSTGVQAGIILCTLRHFREEQSMETVKLVEEFYDRHICGFDIAANEVLSINNHIKAFDYARKKGLNITAHGGEARGADSVTEILDHLNPTRIGHGVRSLEDPEVAERIKLEKIHLEVCPTSNVQTNVFDTISNHNIDTIYNSGISVSINTDSRTVTRVTLSSEYELLHKEFDWTIEHFKRCNLEAVKHVFTDAETKKKLRKKVNEGYM